MINEIISNDKMARQRQFASSKLNISQSEKDYELNRKFCDEFNKSSYGKVVKTLTGMILYPVIIHQ